MRAVTHSNAVAASKISYPNDVQMFNVQKCMYFKAWREASISTQVNITIYFF